MQSKTDGNHAEIRDGLRALGAKVFDTHKLGDGFPDLTVLWQGEILLMEIKDGNLPPSKQSLTPKEAIFHNEWKEARRLYIVNSFENAVKALNGKL